MNEKSLNDLEYEYYTKAIAGELPIDAPVDSVNGKTGVVVLDNSDLGNVSGVVGATTADALNELNLISALGIDGVLVTVPADVSTSIPFQFVPVSLGQFVAPTTGDYRILLSLITSMSATNRSWVGEFRLNGSPLVGYASPFVSIEHKDNTDRVPHPLQLRLSLVQNDVIEFVFGTESFGSTAYVRAGSQLEIFKVDIA